jgi:prepilin-type N-terminal cleavage/methylation domain-containing protein
MFIRRSRSRGFTLVEVLAVVIIVAILAAIAVPIYLSYVESARSNEAQTAIGAIWTACRVFHQTFQSWPSAIEDLKPRYLSLDPAAEQNWTFSIIGDPPQQIKAISTASMPGGASKEVTFDVNTGKFSGYGTD